MYIPSFKLISQSMLKKSPENADGRTDGQTDRRTDGQTDGRTLPRHNTSRFSNGRIKNDIPIILTQSRSTFWPHLHNTVHNFGKYYYIHIFAEMRLACQLADCEWNMSWMIHVQPWRVYNTARYWLLHTVNSFHPKRNDRLFADDIFICILVNEKFCISVRISLKFIPEGHIDKKSALV